MTASIDISLCRCHNKPGFFFLSNCASLHFFEFLLVWHLSMASFCLTRDNFDLHGDNGTVIIHNC